MNSHEPAITASDLSKSFRDNIAVNGLDLSVPRGSVYGLIGLNGAGKRPDGARGFPHSGNPVKQDGGTGLHGRRLP